MIVVTITTTEACGEYFDGEPFDIGDTQSFTYNENQTAKAYSAADRWETEGFIVKVTVL